jgi:HAD superfamily hydrolase (TIGR01509 family)
MSILAVILDMDGLMLDTEPLYKIAWQRAAVECGYPICEELYFDLIGRTRLDGENILFGAFGPEFPLSEFRARCARCEALVLGEKLPAKKPGLDTLLDLLDGHHIAKAVATSTERHIAEKQLSGWSSLDRFDVLATGDEVRNGKPSPDLFLLTAERLATDPSQCLVLEDSEAGIIAAHRARMRVYVVPDLKQPSGPVEKLAQAKFDSLAAVEKHLRSRLT